MMGFLWVEAGGPPAQLGGVSAGRHFALVSGPGRKKVAPRPFGGARRCRRQRGERDGKGESKQWRAARHDRPPPQRWLAPTVTAEPRRNQGGGTLGEKKAATVALWPRFQVSCRSGFAATHAPSKLRRGKWGIDARSIAVRDRRSATGRCLPRPPLYLSRQRHRRHHPVVGRERVHAAT